MPGLCYVVGGGPSLRGFDFSKLGPVFKIGANKSAWVANCDVLVSIDSRFHRGFVKEIEGFQGAKYMVRNEAEDPCLRGVNYLRRKRDVAFSTQLGVISGTNSGYAGLNLAFLFGFKKIRLLGFDFKWVESRSHFHDGYFWQSHKTPDNLRNWVNEFGEAKRVLDAHGVEVVNYVGPHGSHVTQFSTKPLSELAA